MKIITRHNKIVAIHTDSQDVLHLYPGCSEKHAPDHVMLTVGQSLPDLTPEQQQQAEQMEHAWQQKKDDVLNNLPSWQHVADAIDNASTVAALKVIIKKLARIVYWLAKDKVD